jgi:arylsulfatase A-like enzyme
MHLRMLSLTLCALSWPVTAQQSPGTTDAPPNVLLICWDTVRADHLTPYGYGKRNTTPFLAELAQRGLLLQQAWSTAGWTKPSVTSFLTGVLPASHGAYEGHSKGAAGLVSDALDARATTLAERFIDVGYQSAAFVKNGHLRPGLGLEQGFETYVDQAGDARAIRWSALDWLDQRDRDLPFFLYLHCLDAHWPYTAPDEFAGRFAPIDSLRRFQDENSAALFEAFESGATPFTPADHTTLTALYDGCLRYLDWQLELLWLGLEQRGLTENLVLALVSDHGESFGEGGHFGHGHGLSPELLRVPFVLLGPGVPAQRSAAPASLLDLAPTLLAAAGLEVDPLLPGINRLAHPGLPSEPVAEHKAPDRYLASLRSEARLVELDFLGAAPAGDQRHIAIGQRLEVQLERSTAGVLVADEIELSEDAASEPIELKGRLTARDDTKISVEGLSFPLAPQCRTVYAEGAEGRPAQVGEMIKLRLEGEPLQTTRIKHYLPGEAVEFELRGPCERFDFEQGRGQLQLAGLEISLDDSSRIAQDRERRLSRTELLAAQLSAWENPPPGLELTRRAYRLGSEGREPILDLFGDLDLRLAARLRQAAENRSYDATAAQKPMNAEEIQVLRDMGYVR